MIIKTKKEIEYIENACRIVKETLEIIEKLIKPGIATCEIDRAAEEYILSKNAKPSFKNYQGFKHSACVSINEEVVHGVPGSRTLNEGDIVSVDIGAYLNGYHGDAARTFPVGTISESDRKLINITKECFYKGISEIKLGGYIGDLSARIQKHAESNGYSVIRELIGHGIGRELHEDPQVPNFGDKGTGAKIRDGLCIAVEPMLSSGDNKIVTMKDGWTIKTADNSKSAHYENTIAVIDGSVRILTI